MWTRRIAYLATLLGSLVFYGFYREWFSWFLLMLVVLLPLFSLVISLPAMLSVQAGLRCPESGRVGVPIRTALEIKCKYPAPPVSCRIRLHNSLTDRRYIGLPGERIPTEHCGLMRISYDRLFVYDYLGLFCRRLRKGDSCVVYIMPKPVPTVLPSQMGGRAVLGYRPKPGGGFAEDHDLRLYRPGDDLRSIHWKLSAKTGKLIYREAIETIQSGYLLKATLSGKPAQIDRKLGQLLWLSQAFSQRQIGHEIACRTGDGEVRFRVTDSAALEEGLRKLLRSSPVKDDGAAAEQDVTCQQKIGGGADEA